MCRTVYHLQVSIIAVGHSHVQAASHSSNMYLTAAAQNLLCVKLAGEMG